VDPQDVPPAFDEGQLILHYQPIIELQSGRVTRLEALVRWQHPERGTLAPVDFIPLAEETGLIVPLGRYVLHSACQQAVQWTRDGHAPVAVQVNLSARELEDPGLIEHVQEALETSGLPPQRLTLEITETLLVRDAESGGSRLAALRALGVKLALDDFGTGYSSLSYLRSLPLDMLKIAKEFVDGLSRNEDDQAFVALIVQLARTRGLEVVAEGIEDIDQFHALRAAGCDLGQGYYFGRPLSADDPQLSRAIGTAANSQVD
jgi:EAL domain-containing protein (putative c-di-GMP-specific phosphodiesterase class I)